MKLRHFLSPSRLDYCGQSRLFHDDGLRLHTRKKEEKMRFVVSRRERPKKNTVHISFFALTCPRLHDMMKIDGKSDCIVKTFFASKPR